MPPGGSVDDQGILIIVAALNFVRDARNRGSRPVARDFRRLEQLQLKLPGQVVNG